VTTTTAPEIKQRPRHERRLREILKVSARVFAEEGYEKASIRRIAGELGQSLSALYHYVRTKEELLFLIQRETFSSLAETLVERLEAAADPEERLRLMVENHVGHFVRHIDELKVCAHEMESLSGDAYREVLEIRRRYFRAARSVVADALRHFDNDRLDPNLATLNLFGMLNWIYMWYDPERNSSAKELADQIAGLFLYGLASGKALPRSGRGGKEG